MFTQSTETGRLILVRMDTGDDILHALRAAVERHGIKNAVILGEIGSIQSYHFHIVDTIAMPPHDLFLKGDGPFDILSLTGLVMDGRVHAHITFSDAEKAMGGHLEEGCRVLTFSVAYLLETSNADLTDWDRMGALKADV